MRMGLAIEESRAFWLNYSPGISRQDQVDLAFEARWFGAKSYQRVGYLVNVLEQRFAHSLNELKAWNPVEQADKRWICHFHLQFSDPLYRRFSTDYLIQCLQKSPPSVDSTSAQTWINAYYPKRWAGSTATRLSSGLLSSLREAGFCQGRRTPWLLQAPWVSDQALAYIVYFLRRARYEQTFWENSYFFSLSLGADIERRLLNLPYFTYHKVGQTRSLELKYVSFLKWLEAIGR